MYDIVRHRVDRRMDQKVVFGSLGRACVGRLAFGLRYCGIDWEDGQNGHVGSTHRL
jgi:hypothetical protein